MTRTATNGTGDWDCFGDYYLNARAQARVATVEGIFARKPSERMLVDWVLRLPALLLIAGVRVYQLTLGPWLGGNCRFQPTCSHYFVQAVEKYGAMRGAWKGIARICRCHPFHPGGYDPP